MGYTLHRLVFLIFDFKEAIDWLCNYEDVYHDGLGIVAVSRGGEMALLIAAHSEKVTNARRDGK